MESVKLTDKQKSVLSDVFYEKGLRLGRMRLKKYVDENYPDVYITTREVAYWLKSQERYQLDLQKKNVKSLDVSRMTANRPFQIIQFDLINKDVTAPKNAYKYIFTCVDLFTRFAWAIPLKLKKTENIIKCLKAVLEDVEEINLGSEFQSPIEVIMCDNAKEFRSLSVQAWGKSNNIKFSYGIPYVSQSQAFVESFNKTFQMLLNHYVATKTRNNNWVKAVPKVIEMYNDNFHTSIKMSPHNAILESYKDILEEYKKTGQYPAKLEISEDLIPIGTYVRHLIQKGKLMKKTSDNWSPEIYSIKQVKKSSAINGSPKYILQDDEGEEASRQFLKDELQIIPVESSNSNDDN